MREGAFLIVRPESASHTLAHIALATFFILAGAPVSLASDFIAGVTYGRPSIAPGQYDGDLSQAVLAPKASTGVTQPKPYRPRLSRPASPKIGVAPAMTGPQTPAEVLTAPMPSPIQNFAGLNDTDVCTGGQCGAGWPPDPNGDVGPNHYIEAVNDAIAIYTKTGSLLASFTEDHLWKGQGTPCDGNSQGDPIVLYDWLADRFILTWFAFEVDGIGNPVSPFYQCIAASKTSDPVAGGWWLYPVRTDPGGPGLPPIGDINDYSKFGLWHDCLYLGSNSFDPAGNYDGVAFASFSRSDLYSGAPLTYSLGRLPPATNAFTLVPSNNQGTGARAAQPGTPNYFVSESGTAFDYEVRTFTAGPNCGAGGTLSAATLVSQAPYTFLQGAIVPQPNTRKRLDMIDDRIMQRVQYRKIGNAESIWVTHPVGAAGGNVAMQWAQLDVSGGTIAPTPIQEQIHAPDATLNRFMGSLAVDVQGNMALGYSTSNGVAPNFPSIAYSGRLASDPLGTLPQTEVQLIAGAGSQTNSCGGAPCDRWGDYSAMTLDPADGCTFWYVNEYYSSQTNGSAGNWQTRIGSLKFPGCSALPPTTTTLQSSLNPSNVGDTVTFTAMVSGSAPTGSVSFFADGSGISGCNGVPLTGGGGARTAQCMTNALGAGAHTIVAIYAGDPNNAGSASPALAQQVHGAGGASVVLASSANPVRVRRSVTFTATVMGAHPTGTIRFASNGSAISGCHAVGLSDAGNTTTAACTTSFGARGSYSIVADYSGDGVNAPATSSPLIETVRRR